MITKIIGKLLLMEGGLMGACALLPLAYGEASTWAFVYSMLLAVSVGGVLTYIGRNAVREVSKRDSIAIVVLVWLLFTIFGTLPFLLSGEIPTVTNAFFETMSGFSTTGATILDDIERMSLGLLFWRSLIQWIGGLGVVFFTIAVLPAFGISKQSLYSAETTGITRDKIHPKISTMAKWIWGVYCCLTLILFILLYFGGMSGFDAICHAFTTMATGGFSTKQASIAHWNSPFIEYVITVFMCLGSINFGLYFMAIKGKWLHWVKDVETRTFFISVLVITLMITISLVGHNHYEGEEAFRKAVFQVVSLHTSTGFITDDYNFWMPFTWFLFIFTMCVGGCTGSTAGGAKCMRLLIVLQNMRNELYKMLHPRAVLPVKVNHVAVDSSIYFTVSTFCLIFMTTIFVGTLGFLLSGVGFIESLSLSFSCVGNAGPALGSFGPSFSWNALPEAGKWLASFLMFAGRLEILSILLMMMPTFWSRH